MRTTRMRMRTRAPVRQNPMRACALSVAPSGAESWAGEHEKSMAPPLRVPWEEVGAGARPPMPSSTVVEQMPRVSRRQMTTAACVKSSTAQIIWLSVFLVHVLASRSILPGQNRMTNPLNRSLGSERLPLAVDSNADGAPVRVHVCMYRRCMYRIRSRDSPYQ